MKKALFMVAGCISLLAAVASCGRGKDVSAVPAPQRIEQAGLAHNLALDAVLDDLWERKAQTSLQRSRSINPALRDPVKKETLEDRAMETGLRLLNQLYPNLPVVKIRTDFPTEKIKSVIGKVRLGNYGDIENSLSDFGFHYFKKIVNLKKEEKITLSTFLAKINDIEEEIIWKAPDEMEAELMLTITSIARHSAEYWYKNIYKWAAVKHAELIEVIDLTQGEHFTRSYPGSEGLSELPPGYYPCPLGLQYFYYVDEKGIVYLMQCAEGLQYNPTLCVCDLPINVEGDDEDIISENQGEGISWWSIFLADLAGASAGGKLGSYGAVGVGGVFSIIDGLHQI